MKRIIRPLIILAMVMMMTCVSYGDTIESTKVYEHNDENIRFLGRCLEDNEKGITYFNWTTSGFEFRAEGNKVEATIETIAYSENGAILYPWIAVFVDDFDQPAQVIELKEGLHTYVLYEGEEFGTHNIKVVKRTEAPHSKTGLMNVKVSGEGAKIDVLPNLKQHKIEFIGDSITCGYGIESAPTSGFLSSEENGWETYAAKAARALDAEFNCISVSGIGIYSNYTPIDQINDYMTMPDIYEFTDIYLDNTLGNVPQKWDFSKFQPDLIVINLGTNDWSYISHNIPGRIPQFTKSYVEFLKQVREKNGPNVKILCTQVAFLPEVTAMMENIVNIYKAETGDTAIDIFIMGAPTLEEGIGGNGHPSLKTHERMGYELKDKIRDWLWW